MDHLGRRKHWKFTRKLNHSRQFMTRWNGIFLHLSLLRKTLRIPCQDAGREVLVPPELPGMFPHQALLHLLWTVGHGENTAKGGRDELHGWKSEWSRVRDEEQGRKSMWIIAGEWEWFFYGTKVDPIFIHNLTGMIHVLSVLMMGKINYLLFFNVF